MIPPLRFERLSAPQPEPIFARGPTEGPQLLFIQPLFGELNRTRTLIGDVMRSLAADGFGCWLPELPGQGESETPLEAVAWDQWRATIAAAAAHVEAASGRRPMTVAIRGGALLDDAASAPCGWRLAPMEGAAILRDLLRTRLMSDRQAGREVSLRTLEDEAAQGPILLGGLTLAPALFGGLRDGVPHPGERMRSVQLGQGESRIAGEPLWLRAEPGRHPEMAEAIAADLRAWAASCGIS